MIGTRNWRDDARRLLGLLFDRDSAIVELRALKVEGVYGNSIKSGYFETAETLIEAAAEVDGRAAGIYVTANVVNPDLIARAENRLAARPQATTADGDIEGRRVLFVDVDPVRPSGISATDEEKAHARTVATAIREHLRTLGFPEPVVVDSGNGYHVVYRVDLPSDDGGLVERCLHALAFRFDNEHATVDQKVHNPARLLKLPGTLVRKGDHTDDRPHRRSRIVNYPDSFEAVPTTLLEELAALAPQPEQERPGTGRPPFDVAAFLHRHGLEVRRTAPWQGGTKWILRVCPFNDEHNDDAAYVVQFSSGAIAFGCHHDGCTGRGWADLRDRLAPERVHCRGGDESALEALLARVQEAPEAAFHSDALRLAALLYDKNEGGYSRLIAQLKQVGVRLRDWERAVKRTRTENAAKERARDQAAAGDAHLPTISVNNRQLRDTVDDAWAAVIAANVPEPRMFRRDGSAVRLARRQGRRVIEVVTPRAMFGLCARVANWVQATADEVINVHPESDVALDMAEFPHADLPPLDELITAPVITDDGTLIDRPGYYLDQRLYFAEEGAVLIDAVPERPTGEDLQESRRLLSFELLGDFPFTSDAEHAHAIAAILEPCARRLYTGRSPLHAPEAAAPGSGKTLLIEIISTIATGAPMHVRTLPSSEDEMRKAITAALSQSPSMIQFDNADQRRVVDSATLSAALTAESWTDRLLGFTRVVYLKNRALFFLTGNNPRYSMELARRCVRIRLDPRVDRPWLRTGFRHEDIRGWTRRNRARLLWAVLVLIRNWIACGRPRFGTKLGSFESWSQAIGGILECAGITGFLGNRDEVYELADAEGDAWRELVLVWWARHGGKAVRPTALLELCEQHGLLSDLLGDGPATSKVTRLGLALRAQRDRSYANLRIELASDEGRKGGRAYRLVRLEPGGDDGDVATERPSQRPPTQTPAPERTYDAGGTLGDVEPNPTSAPVEQRAEDPTPASEAVPRAGAQQTSPNVPPEGRSAEGATSCGGGRLSTTSPEGPHYVPLASDAMDQEASRG